MTVKDNKFVGPKIGLYDEGCCYVNQLSFTQPEDCPVKAGQNYKHYKQGNMYTIVCIALDSETQEYMVVYQGWLSGKVWVRPLTEFTSHVSNEEVSIPRFEYIESKPMKVITSWEQFKEMFGVSDNDSRIQEKDPHNRQQ